MTSVGIYVFKGIPFWTAGDGTTFGPGAGVLVPCILPFSTLPSSCSPFISYFFPAPFLSTFTSCFYNDFLRGALTVSGLTTGSAMGLPAIWKMWYLAWWLL